jgi:anti-sigma factor RsiW
MDSNPNEIDELLTGMLDGMLSEDEARRLELSMKADPQLLVRLEELGQLRTALLQGRTKARLAPDFAKRVTAQARQRALELGPEGPSWIVPSGATTPVKIPVPTGQVGYLRPMIYASVLGAAAVFALVMITQQPRDAEVERLGLVATVPEGSSDTEPFEQAVPSELLAMGSGVAGQTDVKDVEIPLPSSAVNPSLAVTPPVPSDVPAAVPATVPEFEPASVAASNAPASRPSATESEPKIARAPDKATDKNGTSRIQAVVPSNAVFTLVFDISVDPVALENRALESIFEKHGIVFADDLAITDDQLKALEDSQLVATESNQEKIGVLFLKASGERLELALLDIIKQFRDFPEVALNMSTHSSANRLVKQLSAIDAPSGVSNFVRPLSAGRSFSAGASGKSVSIKGEKTAGAILAKERQRVSNILILVRPAK